MAIRNLLIVILCSYLPYCSFSQSNYTLINDATVLPGCHCYQLTPDQGNMGGGVYQNNTINLNNSFDYTFNVFLGSNGSSGADGMTFILTPNINGIGAQGGGLGYSGLAGNSLAVEYDTYQNSWDPAYNHIALEYNGQVEHPTGTIMGPYPALPGNANMDDGAWHTTRIVWNVNTHTYTVYFDGNLIFSYSGNIVTNYFGGNPVVNWGWAGSTGGAENTQQFCVLSTSSWTAGTNYQSCSNTTQFTDISTSNVATVQSWAWNFGDPSSGASNISSLENPTHTFSAAGTYTVTLIITDISGCPDTFSHSVIIAPPITMTPTLTNPACNGASTGDISVATTGGFGASAGYGGYMYTWSGGGIGPTDVGLTAGTYNVTVTDGVCSATGSYTLNQPSALSATTSHTDAPCGGTGTATITITGGTTPYSGVTWDAIAATPGPSTYTASGLPVGVVVANFHDANGCSAALTYRETISQLPCGYTLSTSTTDVTCYNGTNGSATLTVTGSIGTVTITWTNSGGTTVGSGATINNLPAGTYTYHYSDTRPQAFTGTVTINQPGGAMAASISTINTTCSYLNNGSAVASVTANGTSPYSYAWSAAGQTNSPTATGLSPGPISVTITDHNGCTATASGTVSGQTAIALMASSTPDSCYQTLSGTVSVAASGGTPTYTYQWSTGPTGVGSTIYALGAGPYQVTVTDHNGCTATAATSINQPPQLTATITDSNIACFGGASGTATVTAGGGNGGYIYAWSNSTSGTTVSGLTPNTYYVTVTDVKHCKVIDSAQITQPPSAFMVKVDSVNVKCFGLPTGSITLVLSGGSTPYGTVMWSGGATGTTRTNLSAGTYSYTVSDAHLCQVTGSVTITQPATSFMVGVASTNVGCFGASTGTITLTPSGGTTPYATAQWLDGFIGDMRSSLPAGVYYWGDSDHNGCFDTGHVVITQPLSAFTVTSAITNVGCNGSSTGSIMLTESGGTTPYPTVTWRDGGATGLTRSNLAAGNYSYIATDANGCTDSATLTVTQPLSAFAVIPAVTNVSCFGNSTGTIMLTESGGTMPYPTVTWRDGGATGAMRSNLAAGTYSYIATDANGCTDSATVSVTQPATAFTVTPTVVNVVCYSNSSGSISLALAGGTMPYPSPSVTWRDGGATGTTRNNLPAGNYSYIATDGAGCIDSATLTITQPATGLTVTNVITNEPCYGQSSGTIMLTLTGGAMPYPTPSVTWRDGGATGTTRSNLPAGNYSYIAYDGGGCTDSATLAVTQPDSITAVAGPVTNITCSGANNGAVTVTATGGTGALTYELDGSGTFQSTGAFTGLDSGQHTVTVQDANMCSNAVTFNVTAPNALALSVTSTVNDVCAAGCNGSITVNATGGTMPYQYTIDGINYQTSNTFSNLCANPSYTISVQDANQCPANVSDSVTQPAPVTVTQVSNTPPTCNNGSDGSFTVSASGGSNSGFTYDYNNGPYQASGTFTGLPAGTYNVMSMDANGCTGSLSVTIANTPATSSFTTLDTNVSCFGGSNGAILATVAGTATPYSFAWSNGGNTADINGLPIGTYIVRVTDANGCPVYGGADSVNTITQPGQISAPYTATMVTCYGDSNACITVTPGGGVQPFSNAWSNGITTTTGNPCNLKAGTYSDTLTDANGCQYIDAGIVVGQPSAITITLDSVTPVSCQGDSNGAIAVSVQNGTPGYSYRWSQGSTGDPVTGLPVGSYTVTVTDANQCTASDTASVGANNPIVLNATKTDVLCTPLQNGSIILTVTGGAPAYQYLWSNGATTSSLANLSAGTDSVTVTDSRGCMIDTGFLIKNDSAFTITADPDTVTINQGDMITLEITPESNNAGYPSFKWSPSDGLSCTDCQGPEASPVVTTQYQVTATTDSGCVANTQVLVTVIPQHQLYIPNAFTPNNDGVNDYWQAFGDKKTWVYCSASVFDRWGEKVFESDDINFQWDGKYKGEYVLPGEYVYVFKVVFVDDYNITNKGTITVIR
jgi:gliding motility-associated-like protein